MDFSIKIQHGIQDSGWITYGQIPEGSTDIQGIGLRISPDGVMHEGLFDENANGFGRCISNTGEYFVGYCKDGAKQGYGKFVNSKGKIQDGNWINDVFQDPNSKVSSVKPKPVLDFGIFENANSEGSVDAEEEKDQVPENWEEMTPN